MEPLVDLDRLIKIKDEQEWKQAYEEELHKLSTSAKEINRLTYHLYATGEQSEELQSLIEARKQIIANPAFKSMLQDWSNMIDNPLWKKRLALMLAEIEKQEIESDSEVLTLKNQLEGKLFSHPLILTEPSLIAAKFILP